MNYLSTSTWKWSGVGIWFFREKLHIDEAKQLMAKTCIDVTRNISNLDAYVAWRKRQAIETYAETVRITLQNKRRRSFAPPGIGWWKQQYAELQERYKFLVLCGP